MEFYYSETLVGLAVASLPAILSIYFFYWKENKKTAIYLLLLSALLLRLLMISIDPYLNEWDERFHALVAKNMIQYPFKPMLFTKHIMPFNPEDWGSLNVWVHKQPLFLWQMALSMKVFGVNTIALRLPSAIMGTIIVWLTWDISRNWTKNESISFLAALLSAFSYYTLELISGRMSLDHNDLAFLFYMTCGIWGITKYNNSTAKIKWSVLIGLFVGAAILNKWLVGLLIFGGWGLQLILSENRLKTRYYLHILLASIISCLIFLPWQFYILNNFPLESAIAFEHNRRHISEDLGHPGSIFFHIKYLFEAYHWILIIFLPIGVYKLWQNNTITKSLTLAFLGMIIVLFSFFSLFVQSKMPAFVYPVASVMLIFMSAGFMFISSSVFDYLKIAANHRNQLLGIAALILCFYMLKPTLIADIRASDNGFRNNKIYNSTIYKNLNDTLTSNYVIMNCRPYENIELMFFKDALAYHWYPAASQTDSIQNNGFKLAAFDYPNDNQQLPNYFRNDSSIVIINELPK